MGDDVTPATAAQVSAAGYDPSSGTYVVDSDGNVYPLVGGGASAMNPLWPLLIVLGVTAFAIFSAGRTSRH